MHRKEMVYNIFLSFFLGISIGILGYSTKYINQQNNEINIYIENLIFVGRKSNNSKYY